MTRRPKEGAPAACRAPSAGIIPDTATLAIQPLPGPDMLFCETHDDDLDRHHHGTTHLITHWVKTAERGSGILPPYLPSDAYSLPLGDRRTPALRATTPSALVYCTVWWLEPQRHWKRTAEIRYLARV
jgi:hypothetical protein